MIWGCALSTRRADAQEIFTGKVLPPLWETGDMKKPELTDIVWLGPKEEMDRASHRVGKCSECLEIICVEKAVTEPESTQPETTEKLYEAFRAHVKLKHAGDLSQVA